MSVKTYTAQGNETTMQDYEITVDMAKELEKLQSAGIGTETNLFAVSCILND